MIEIGNFFSSLPLGNGLLPPLFSLVIKFSTVIRSIWPLRTRTMTIFGVYKIILLCDNKKMCIRIIHSPLDTVIYIENQGYGNNMTLNKYQICLCYRNCPILLLILYYIVLRFRSIWMASHVGIPLSQFIYFFFLFFHLLVYYTMELEEGFTPSKSHPEY